MLFLKFFESDFVPEKNEKNVVRREKKVFLDHGDFRTDKSPDKDKFNLTRPSQRSVVADVIFVNVGHRPGIPEFSFLRKDPRMERSNGSIFLFDRQWSPMISDSSNLTYKML